MSTAVEILLARELARGRGFGPEDAAAWITETDRIRDRARLAVGEAEEPAGPGEGDWTLNHAPAHVVFAMLAKHPNAVTVWIGPPPDPGTDGALVRVSDEAGMILEEQLVFSIAHRLVGNA